MITYPSMFPIFELNHDGYRHIGGVLEGRDQHPVLSVNVLSQRNPAPFEIAVIRVEVRQREKRHCMLHCKGG